MKTRAQMCSILILASSLLPSCGGGDVETPKPQPDESAAVIYSENALSAAERQQFYHQAEGSELFPVAWVIHMEDPDTKRPFIENLERFGLIPDPEGPFFEGTQVRMPVGIAVSKREGTEVLEPLGLSKMVGVNCAACHVGQIEAGGKKFRIDGGPNLFNIVGFLEQIGKTAKATYTRPEHLKVYLESRIRAGEIEPAVAAKGVALLKELEGLMKSGGTEQALRDFVTKQIGEEAHLMKSYLTLLERFTAVQHPETVPGFGRADAFGTARALLFGKENAQPLTSPSSFPYIWNMPSTAWFHWPSNTNSVMQRNIGEALGLGASADSRTGESTIDFYGLHMLEQLAYKTRAPKWPEDVLGKIDQAKADRGEQIYKDNCTRCHDSGKPDAVDPNVINYTLIPLQVVGTDDNEAKNWTVPVTVDGKSVEFGAAQKVVLDAIFTKGKEKLKKTRPDLDVDKIDWESGRKNPPAWRVAYANPTTKTLGYPTKPLAGIWATAPYLHNGSVPTLADMLTPPADRPKTFMVGSREYDAKKLGYRADQGWVFDTTLKGNSNQGHPFGTTLKPEEKEDLMEFLKRLSQMGPGS
jgi:cytochrome c peroxidase